MSLHLSENAVGVGEEEGRSRKYANPYLLVETDKDGVVLATEPCERHCWISKPDVLLVHHCLKD